MAPPKIKLIFLLFFLALFVMWVMDNRAYDQDLEMDRMQAVLHGAR